MIESALIERMSVVERLQAMEQLWDALASKGGVSGLSNLTLEASRGEYRSRRHPDSAIQN
jgi:hypothetical protein